MAFSILGCPHNHLSFPMVIPEAGGKRTAEGVPGVPQAHVTCLDCGREFWYDWTRMRRLSARPQPVYTPRRAA